MSGKSEKLFDGVTNIDDDLIEALGTSAAPQSEYVAKNRRGAIAIAVAAVAVFVIAISVVNSKINKNADSREENLSNRMGCNVETTEFSTLNAQEIAKAEFDYSALERLEKKIKEEADYKEIAEVIEIWIEDGTEGFLLSDVSNLGISTGNLPMIDLNEKATANIAYEFLFDGEEPVGYVMFFEADNKLNYSISLNTANTSGYYFDFLMENKDKSFIVLKNGLRYYFLSEDNLLYRASDGKIAENISVIGDCYHAFAYDKVSVSYDIIMERKKL